MKKSKLKEVFQLPKKELRKTGNEKLVKCKGVVINNANQKAIRYYVGGMSTYRIVHPDEKVQVGQMVNSFKLAEYEEFILQGNEWKPTGNVLWKAIDVQ